MPHNKTKVVFSHIKVNFSDGKEAEYHGADGKAIYRALEKAYAEDFGLIAVTLDDSNSILHLAIDHITKFECFYGTEVVY